MCRCKEEEKASMMHCSSCNVIAHGDCRDSNVNSVYTCELCVKREFRKMFDNDQRICAFCHKKGDYTPGGTIYIYLYIDI